MSRKAKQFIEQAIEYTHNIFRVYDKKSRENEIHPVKSYVFSVIRELIDKLKTSGEKKVKFTDFIWKIVEIKDLEIGRE